MREGLRSTVAPAAHPRRRGLPGDAGRGPEVQGVRDALSARGALRLRALLRAARGRVRRARPRAAAELQRRIQAGPLTLWRYADFLPVERPLPRELAARRAGRRWCAPTGSPSGSALGEVWIKNDAANPTHSFKDRVVVGRARARAWSSASTRVACASTGNLANAVAAHAADAGLPAYVFIPPTSRSRRSSPPASTARRSSPSAATTTTSTGSAPRSPASASWAFVNVNVRPYYAEGSKTLAYEIAEQLGWELPDRVVGADRLRLAVHEDRARLRGVPRPPGS